MKLAFVVPRYGLEVVGGAETAARQIAERVAARGWEVEVMTTCAIDDMTWADELPPGEATLNGVTVHRWRSSAGRDKASEVWAVELLKRPEAATKADAERWIDLQGPVCPDVVEAAASTDADLVAFCPYLYYPTVKGVPRLGKRAILHPAAHDEPPLGLPVFAEVFARAGGLVFLSAGERRLVHRRFKGAQTPQILLGLGVERQPAAPKLPAAIGDRPYVACIGRFVGQKGIEALTKAFSAYKSRRPGPLALVYAGPVVDTPPEHPDIVVLGPVEEPAKWALLENAQLLVSPSALESFALVVVEAWAVGTPVLVNARCEATRDNCEASGGGLWFDGYAGFEAAMDLLMADPDLRWRLGQAGQRYVEANFTWPVLIQRYQRFVEQVASRA
ncbi:MAG: glycosyltransferase family 4 protein [Acidimicrobiales bacterium]